MFVGCGLAGVVTDIRVPLYALSSLIALYSLNAAFFIDAIRDLYEVSYMAVLTQSSHTGFRHLHLPPATHHIPRWRA